MVSEGLEVEVEGTAGPNTYLKVKTPTVSKEIH